MNFNNNRLITQVSTMSKEGNNKMIDNKKDSTDLVMVVQSNLVAKRSSKPRPLLCWSAGEPAACG